MRSAVVVAGGYSTRFGERDKATARLDGDPLIRRVVDRIAPAVDEIVVNCRGEQRERLATALAGRDYRFAVDPEPDRGPVAGIQTGCQAACAELAFVTACDMPFVHARLAADLFEAVAGDAAVPRSDGRLHPLAAVYHTDITVDACEEVLRCRSSAVTALLDNLDVTAVPVPEPSGTFTDVDTPDALRDAESRAA